MPYNYLVFNEDDLNNGIVSASYFDVDAASLYEQKILDEQNFFGDNNDDIIELSIYSDQEDQLVFNRIIPRTTYSVLEGSYRDVNNEPQTYSVKNPITNYALNFNELLLHTQQDLKLNELSPGLYKILYNPMRYIAGNPDNRLFIKEISPSRTEIRFSYAFNREVNESSRLDAIKISSFANKKFTFLQIIDEIIPLIDKNPVQENFNDNIDNNNIVRYAQLLGLKSVAELQEYIFFTYTGYNKNINSSLSTDIDIISNVTFTGASQQLKNFVYSYNEVSYTEQEIDEVFRLIIAKVSQDSILRKTTLIEQDLNDMVNFFVKVIYDSWLVESLTKLLTDYYNKFYGLYKNALNFDNGILIKILDHTSYINPIDNSINVQVKLDNPLPNNFSLKDTCWISNISLSPLYFKANLYLGQSSRKVYLNGVNFSIDVDNVYPSNDSLQTKNIRSLENSKESLKRKLNDLLIDYTNFSNFINFSSAELRTKIAKSKIQRYELLDSYRNEKIDDANSEINSSISSSYIFEIDKVLNEQIDLLDTFDEYESYLFYNTSSINSLIDEGIVYDENNYNSLVYQSPNYIKNNEDYADYLKFTSMVGHMFDNILLYIKKFPKNYPINFNDTNDYPKNYIDELLNSFNWNTTNFKFEKSNLTQLYFNNTESSGSLSSSYFDYTKAIFNRMANNLSYIYKTKGNTTSFDLIQNIFGIPRELINVTEYVTPSIIANKDIFYDFDDIIYATKFDSNQYINFKFTSSDYKLTKTSEWTFGSSSVSSTNVTQSLVEEFIGANTLELSFKTNEQYSYDYNDEIDLIKKYRTGTHTGNNHDWRIYLKKTGQRSSGKLIFEFSPPEVGDTTTIVSKEMPFFNGDFYTLMLKREIDPNLSFDVLLPTSQSYSLTQSITSNAPEKYSPRIYTFSVNQYYGSQLNFTDTKTKSITYSYNQYFSTGSYYLGNYSSSVNFVGNIDKVKFQKYSLDNKDFKEHSYNLNSISIPDKKLIYENMYYLWSFDAPINLYNGSGISTVDNQNNRYSNKFYAYNFGQSTIDRGSPYCDTISADIFPYQFEKFNIKQAINSNKYGPNYRGNVNINKIEQVVDTNLVPYETSAYTNDIIGSDSNLIGYYISPYQYLNSKIEDFLGKEGISDIIGDPKYINSRNYPELEQRQKEFAATNLKYIYPQEFYTTYKFYIDFSVFEFVKKLSPSRSSLKTGLLLEPSIFDRKKFNYKDAVFEIQDGSNTVYDLPFNINAKFTQSIINTMDSSSGCIIPLDYTNIGNESYNYSYMEIPDSVDDRDFIYTKYGKYINVNDNGFLIRDVIKQNYNDYYSLFNDRRTDGFTAINSIRTFTGSFNKVTKLGSGYGLISNQITGSVGYKTLYRGSFGNGYSDRHLSKFIRVGTRRQNQIIVQTNTNITNGVRIQRSGTTTYTTYTKGKNSSLTTVNRNGILNGSQPIITIPGFISLDMESDNWNRYGNVTNTDGINQFNPLALTASLYTSASLDAFIMNL